MSNKTAEEREDLRKRYEESRELKGLIINDSESQIDKVLSSALQIDLSLLSLKKQRKVIKIISHCKSIKKLINSIS